MNITNNHRVTERLQDMNTLLLTSEFPPQIGGIAAHVYELARHLDLLQDQVAVLAPSQGKEDGAEYTLGFPIYRKDFRFSGKPFFDLQLAIWLRRYVASARPDIIHVHGMKPLTATRFLRNMPVVFTNHTSGFLKRLAGSAMRRARTARQLSHVAAVIAPSRELLAATRTMGYTGPAHYVSNGVDTDRFSLHADARERLRRAWKVRHDEAVVLLARRLVKKNGVSDFARACRMLSGSRFRIVIAGDGPERVVLDKIFSELDIADRVHFLGAVPNADMPEVYSGADLAVLPSIMEATSIAGLEAMACGLSLVGTDVGGIPDLISDGVTGLLVPANSPDALGAAIRKLVEAPEPRQAFGDAARQKAVAEFSWPRIAERTREIMGEAVSR